MATDLQPVTSASTGKHGKVVEQHLDRVRQRIRTLDLTAAALGLLAGTLAYGVLLALCDRRWELSPLARQAAFAFFVVAATLYAGVALVRPLCRRINPYYAARKLEETLPEAKNSVINWLDLHDQPLPPAILRSLDHRAARDLGQADLERAVSARRLNWLGGLTFVLFLVALILFLLGPRQFGSLLNRAFVPFAEASLATRTRLILLRPEGGDAIIPLGRAVSIAVQVEGKIPDPAKPDALRLLYRHNPADPYEEKLLKRGDSSREWEITVPPAQVHNGLWYKVTGGDAETPEYRVQVRSTPLVTGFEVTYHYRKYLGWRPETTRDPNLQGPRGTEVVLVARTNRPVKQGELTIGNEPPIPAETVPEDRQALRFRLVLEKEGAYRVWFTSVEGERNTDPRPYTIRVFADQVPKVELTEPGRDIQLPVNGLLRLAGSATDDFGLTVLTLRMQVAGGPALQPKRYREGKSFQLADGGYPQVLEYKDFVELAQVKRETGLGVTLEAGQVIEYWLEAADTCDYPEPNIGKSKVYRVTLAPPQKDPAQQDQERSQAREEQKNHEAAQDKQQEKLNQERQAQGQPDARAPETDKQPGSNEDKVRKQAEDLERALQKREQEKGAGQPQESKGDGKGEGKPEPKTSQDQNQGEGNPEARQEPGGGKPEPKPGQESNPNKGERKSESKPGQEAAGNKGAGKPEPSAGKGEQKATREPAAKPESGLTERPDQGAQPQADPAKGQEKPEPKTDKPAPRPNDRTGSDQQPGEQKAQAKPEPKSETGQEKKADQSDTNPTPKQPRGASGGEKQGSSPGESKGAGAKGGAGAAEPKGGSKDSGTPMPADSTAKGEEKPATQNPDSKGSQSPAGSGRKDGDSPPATGDAPPGGGSKKDTASDIPSLAKDLKSPDEKTRQEAARRLEEMSRNDKDAQRRQAAKEALKQAGEKPGGQPEQGEKSGRDRAAAGEPKDEGKQGEGSGASPQRPGKPAGTDAAKGPSAKPSPGGTPKAQPKESPSEKSPPGSASDGPGKPGQQGPMTQPARPDPDQKADGERSEEGGEQRGGFGRNDRPAPSEREPEAGAPADPRHRKRAGTLQLEDFKKKVNKDVLKDLNWTEEDYRRFLKEYEELLRQEGPGPGEKENLAAPRRGGGSLPNEGVRQVNPGGRPASGTLERGGVGLPPPEFREAHKKFTQHLSELERRREKK
jgi:hypothetical protein